MTDIIQKKRAKVVVLGDIGRSPRMQYHALSLANNGISVDMIGYLETQPIAEIIENPHITITRLQPLGFNVGPKLVLYAAKAIWQAVSLLLTLFISGRSDYLLCQNPPAIPTLPVCRFYCLVTKTQFVIDWHNYAYTIMALTLHKEHFLVKISKYIEKFFGQSAVNNLCVSYAMKDDLLRNWDIVASVLYDRPPKMFHPISIKEKHNWFLKLSEQYSEFGCGREQLNHPKGQIWTAFTKMVDGDAQLLENRPGLLFSSTSWTPDEDFGILMDALQVYEITYVLTKKLPTLICVITGRGPMKEFYINKIAERKWQHIKVITPWLEASDYPRMVASADLGVCLHTSSSGLDLPMKVVDMFGAGLPVCAFDYMCLNELIETGVNGYTFKTSDELLKQIVSWFEDFPNNEKRNKTVKNMCKELLKFQESRWEENWLLRAKKIFQ